MHTNLQIVNLRQRPVLFLFFLSFSFDLKHAKDQSDLSRYYACAWPKLSGQEGLPFQQRTMGTENFLYLLHHCWHHDRSRQTAWLDEESVRNNLHSHGHWKLSVPAPALPAHWQIKTGSLARWRVVEEQSAHQPHGIGTHQQHLWGLLG